MEVKEMNYRVENCCKRIFNEQDTFSRAFFCECKLNNYFTFEAFGAHKALREPFLVAKLYLSQSEREFSFLLPKLFWQ